MRAVMIANESSSFTGLPPHHAHARRRARGFTFPELLVVLAIVIILLGIFIPYILATREAAHRTICTDNLRTIFRGLQAYQRANNSMLPRVVNDTEPGGPAWTAFTGADDANPFAASSSVKPNDVTAALWLLVRQGYITDTNVFVCPSAGGDADDPGDRTGGGPATRGNFQSPANLGYSYSSPYSPDPRYRLTDTLKGGFVLMADMNPGTQAGPDPVRVDFQAKASAFRKINSKNHGGAGQHVLYSEGTVQFWFTPYCAIDNDNIYTAQSSDRPTSQPATTAPSTAPAPHLDPHAPGHLGPDIFPANDRDSYLLPTAK